MDVWLDSSICRLCRDDVSKVPRWRRATKNASTTCIIEGYKNPVDKITKVVGR